MSKTLVLYDGGCHLCSREIEHYRRLDTARGLDLVDIDAAGFNAQSFGVDPRAIHKHLHVRQGEGAWVTGIDGFIAIWNSLPRYQWAARAARLRPIKALLKTGYAAFAAVRPLLPRRMQATCADGACSSDK